MRSLEGKCRLLSAVSYAVRDECRSKNIVDDVIMIRGAFPYNPESKTAHETARRWAAQDCKGKPEIITRENTPFGVTVIDLHHRSEGGRAYKVVDSEMRCFDLREDQIMEVMRHVGIKPGGEIPGTFVWGLLKSQMRLVLVGGQLHREMTSGSERNSAFEAKEAAGELLTGPKLVLGNVYVKKDGRKLAFIGRCRLPGESEARFAFFPIPEPPERTDIAALPDRADRKFFEGLNAVAEAWTSWSWRERCAWDWVGQHKAGYGGSRNDESTPPIVFMSSPKFDACVGTVEDDFWREVRANEKGKHGYGKATTQRYYDGWSLVFEWSKHDPAGTGMEEAHKRGYPSVSDGKKATRMYRDAITWLS